MMDCSTKIQETVCTPGESAACACDAGPYGVQICSAQGSFGTCDCSEGMSCIPGTAEACSCSTGGPGARVCGANRTFAACECMTDLRCEPGTSMGCSCAGGLTGASICGADRAFGACECQSQEITLGVLDFPDPTDLVATHSNHGPFWEDSADLGPYFYWEAWVQPRMDGYVISDGYGGAHALLWGPVSKGAGYMIFQGNVWNGVTSVSFEAGEGPAAGDWGHHALGLAPDPRHGNALTLYSFWNGVCVGMTRFGMMTRHAMLTNSGAGTLFVMGSDHQTLGGRLAAIRGWDTSWPNRSQDPAWAYEPDRVFAPAAPGGAGSDFLAEYTRPAITIPDLSPTGYNGGGTGVPRKHPGKLVNAARVSQGVGTTTADQGFYGNVAPIGPLPTWVEDVDCPYGRTGPTSAPSQTRPPAPDPPPDGALVFDSFARPNQNFVLQRVPSLGKTESGSLGPLDWKTATLGPPVTASPFGLISGRAVFLERQPTVAWIDVGTTDQDVRIERVRLAEFGTTGLAFRVVSGRTWSYVFLDQEQGAVGMPPRLILGSFVDGVAGPITSFATPDDNWADLRVLAHGSTVAVFVSRYPFDYWINVAMVENRPANAAATGAGLTGATTPAQATSMWRAETFTVCAGATPCR